MASLYQDVAIFPEIAIGIKAQRTDASKQSLDIVEEACRTILEEHRRLAGNRAEVLNGQNEHMSRLHGRQRDNGNDSGNDRDRAAATFAHGETADTLVLPPETLPRSITQGDQCQIIQHKSAKSTKSVKQKTTTQTIFFEDLEDTALSRPRKISTRSARQVSLVSAATQDSVSTVRSNTTKTTNYSLPSLCKAELEDSQLDMSEVTKRASDIASRGGAASGTASLFPRAASSAAKMVQDFALANGWLTFRSSAPGESVPWGSVQFARRIAGNGFDNICAMAIVLNALSMAMMVNYAASNNIGKDLDMPIFFIVSECAFTVWFLIELIIRMLADGPCKFWSIMTTHAAWNYFDFVVVAMNVFETYVALTSEDEGGANLTSLRVVRILRVARALRIFRLVRLFRALRKMVLSILGSFTTLLWAVVLLIIIMLVFGLFLTEQVTKHLYRDMPILAEVQDDDLLKRRFGSLSLATYTLFLSVSSGVGWQEVSDPLFKIHSFIGLIFCFYIFFTVFAMLNIITGIFVDTAMSAAQRDKDECISEQLHSHDSAVRQIRKLFDEVDLDNSGEIHEEEFHELLKDPHMMAQLASLGIDVGGAEGLFRLLDLDNSGAITPEEFLVGCMRMKGSAKAIDVVSLMYENKRMAERYSRFMRYVEKQFKMCHEFEQRMHRFMKELRASLHTILGDSAQRTVLL